MHTVMQSVRSTLHRAEGETASISVIIPTKNRASDLRRTLESLKTQSRRPDEILVIDQSPTPSLAPSEIPQDLDYIHAPEISGAAAARNCAMDRAVGELWIFLDDDVILEPDYIEEIVRAYQQGVSGVSGIITNYGSPAFSRRLFEELFVRGAFHDDRQPVYWRADELRFRGPQRVKQFAGSVMSFRASAIGNRRFDTNLRGYSLAEDIDFCARLPRGTVLLIAPRARLEHKRSEMGRSSAHWLNEHSQSSSYMRQRHWHRGWKDSLSFAWLQLGYIIMATAGSIKRGSLEPFRAWISGAARGRALGRGADTLATAIPQNEAAVQG